MKKFRYLIFFISMLALCTFMLASCNSRLSAPTKFMLDQHTQTLEWKPVNNASYYTVSFSDELPEVTTAAPSISLENLAPGVYNIKVMAKSNNDKIGDSKWSSYDFERAQESGLKYQLINGGREYQLIGGGTASGDVVMEAVYRTKPVTSIANKALYNNTKITSITIGENVTQIGDKVFTKCLKLENVVIPEGVTSLGEYAFHSCKALKSVTLPDTITQIEPHTFAWCTALESITIGNSITTIGEYAFSNCETLSSITYNGLEKCEYALNLPNTVEKIDQYAFTECKSAESINLGNGVKNIDIGALESCSSLKKVNLGTSLVTLGSGAFRYCTALTEISIPDSTESIKGACFYGCTLLADISLGSGLQDIAQSVFVGTSVLEAATDMLIVDGWLISVKNTTATVFNVPEEVYGIAGRALEGLDTIQQLNLPTVKYVSTAAFYNCTSMYKATFSDELLVLGEAAFYGCKMLNSITLGSSLRSIGDYVFYDCEKLGTGTPVEIPDSVKSVGCRAFRNTNYYKKVKDGAKGPVYVGKWVVDCVSFSSPFGPIVIADGITGIANFSFVEEISMHIYIADSVEYIGHGAFYLAAASVIHLPKNLKYIDDYAFYGCMYANFGGETFDLVIPEGTTHIGRSAFYSCQTMLSLTVPGTVEYIGKYAFYNCANIGATYTLNVSTGQFDENGLPITEPTDVTGFITLGEGIKHIDDRAFQYCIAIENLEIPDSVTTLGSKTFYNCNALKQVTVGSGIKELPDYMFYKCGNLNTVVLKDGIEKIGDYAFRGCIALTEIDLGNVVEIGDYAFHGCASLSLIELPKTLTSIGDYAFRSCVSLDSIFIPESVQKIGKHAFYGMGKATLYIAHASAPETWDSRFNSSYRPAIWGCNVSDDGSYVVSFKTGNNVISNTETKNVVSAPSRAGYVFLGWATDPGSSTVVYSADNVKDVAADILLYSVWEIKQTNDNNQTEE